MTIQNALMEKAANHWDRVVNADDQGLILHYWESAMLRDLVDANWRTATGCANSAEYIRKVSGRRSFGTGMSIGCGAAEDEISLLEQGVLDRLVISDISNEQLDRAEAFAESRGIDSSRLIRRNIIDLSQPLPEKMDLFYWRQSLHHMLDTEQTITWCRDNLADNGAIYCNDACPPNFMQWDDDVLDWVEMYRSTLPQAYLKDPHNKSDYLPLRPKVASVEHWHAIDPSECADSAAIIPAIKRHAPDAKIAFLGGCIYALALEDIINNFRHHSDLVLLENAMLLDKFLSNAGKNYFFACVLNKRDFI